MDEAENDVYDASHGRHRRLNFFDLELRVQWVEAKYDR